MVRPRPIPVTAPSPVPGQIFELVNLSKIDSDPMVNCYDFALTKVASIQIGVLMADCLVRDKELLECE